MELNRIIYLLEDTLIGKHYCYENDLVEVESADRAKKLQDKGVGLIVDTASDFAIYLRDLQKKRETCVECEQFINRIRKFPIDWQTDEWRKLVEEIDLILPSPFKKEEPKENPKPKTTRRPRKKKEE
ncbi:hypothetical protein C5Y96_09830 [Blastopirellula marina]|uniref:Uncharacterized protein n=2 Tax=Pirellulales TaxID=2691354 RepID=A0A2S8FLT5_9BACT|nr:hypothetical protein C5Y96_09830 [Blastopirellula marina]RCS52238.1 hypothetical protein DTL36_09840 [Bremerella cremea]